MLVTIQIPASIELEIPGLLEYEGVASVESWLMEKLRFALEVQRCTATVRHINRICPTCGSLALPHTKGGIRPRSRCADCGTRLGKTDTYTPGKYREFAARGGCL